MASGDYVLLATTVGNVNDGFVSSGWVAMNQTLGTRTVLNPQCQLGGVGPPWVLMSCPQSQNAPVPYHVELDSLTNGTQQTVTVAPSPGVPLQCAGGPPPCLSPSGVGAYWIRWGSGCYHCALVSYFQNIQTGELRDDPTNATTFADLNSPTLAQSTCPGVRLMRDLDSIGTSWGSLTYDGQFALVTGTNGSVFLERCGTDMRRRLPSAPLASNAGAIVWADGGYLLGMLLPSLQRFSIPLPSVVNPPPATQDTSVSQVALTSDALYVREADGASWQTASPTALPLNTSQPGLTRSRNTLTCKRGSWRNAVAFSYAWQVNGVAEKAAKPKLTLPRAGRRQTASCRVTASNADGTTTATSAQLHVR